MAIPLLSAVPKAATWLWNRVRGRPTVQADRGAVAAGRDQHIGGSVVTGERAIVVHRGGAGLTIVAQSGAIVYVNTWVTDAEEIQKAGEVDKAADTDQIPE